MLERCERKILLSWLLELPNRVPGMCHKPSSKQAHTDSIAEQAELSCSAGGLAD